MTNAGRLVSILFLIICWDVHPAPNLLGYWVTTAERHVVEWVPCPSPEIPDAMCPVYNPFQWEATFTGLVPRFQRNDCADVPYSICYFRYPIAEDWDMNVSEELLITNETVEWGGVCL